MMKNRTIIGIICIVVSLVLIIFAVPWLNRKEDGTVSVVRAKTGIPRGTRITEKMVECVKMRKTDLPEKSLSVLSSAIGQFAACDIFSGDCLTAEKVKEQANGVSDVLYRLEEGEYAVTISFPNATRGFSGQLENGDIVKLYLYNRDTGVDSPEELRYLRVITTLTKKGESRDSAKVGTNSDGNDQASSVMFAVNEAQAKKIFMYSDSGNLCCAFVCHGSDPRAEKYLAEQKAVFEKSPVSSEAIRNVE